MWCHSRCLPLNAVVVAATATTATATALLRRLLIASADAVVGVEKGTLNYVRSHPSMQTFLAEGILEVNERVARRKFSSARCF